MNSRGAGSRSPCNHVNMKGDHGHDPSKFCRKAHKILLSGANQIIFGCCRALSLTSSLQARRTRNYSDWGMAADSLRKMLPSRVYGTARTHPTSRVSPLGAACTPRTHRRSAWWCLAGGIHTFGSQYTIHISLIKRVGGWGRKRRGRHRDRDRLLYSRAKHEDERRQQLRHWVRGSTRCAHSARHFQHFQRSATWLLSLSSLSNLSSQCSGDSDFFEKVNS